MSISYRILCSILILVVLIMAWPQETAAEPDKTESSISKAAVLFLLISNSPRVNGMGGCGIALVDEQSSLYNPAAVGVFHLDKIFSVSSPSSTEWLPQLNLDMRYKTFNVSLGGSTKLLRPEAESHISAGLAFGMKKIDYGAMYYTDSIGAVRDTAHPDEKVLYFSLGAGLEYIGRVGAGITLKKIDSRLAEHGAGDERIDGTADATAFDIGIYGDLPLGRLISSDTTAKMSIDITPALAYVYANLGKDISYIDTARADPLPKQHQISLSLYGGLNSRTMTLLSARLAWEHDRSAISGPPDPINKYGLELGVGNALFLRGGYYYDDYGSVKYATFGVGLNLQGILQFVAMNQRKEDNPTLYYFMTHADLSIDYARYFGEDDVPLDETNFLKLSLSF